MKKRLLSWLMAMTLCLTLLPAAALANGNGVEDLQLTGEQETILSGEEGNAAPGEQQETQLAEGALLPAAGYGIDLLSGENEGYGITPFSGGSHSHEGWTAVENLESIETAGNYYLSKSIDVCWSWHPKSGVVLCLNGFILP